MVYLLLIYFMICCNNVLVAIRVFIFKCHTKWINNTFWLPINLSSPNYPIKDYTVFTDQ